MADNINVRQSLFISLLFAVAGCGRPGTPPPVQLRTPTPDVGVDAFAARKKAQIEAIGQFRVFHQFQFTD